MTIAVSSSSSDAQSPSADRAIGLWLLACCAMIFAMAVIGAITRLTDSGLSIMEWAPLRGALPPLSEAEWQRVFALYQQIPEYRDVNAGMTLAEFKAIFWWEYFHRLWGRLIGVVFLVPFLWFLIRGRIRRTLAPRLALIFVLGAGQGALGWYMVASGFADRTDVSQYRLVAHLLAAVAIYGVILWIALGLLEPAPVPSTDARTGRLRTALAGLSALVLVTVASGGFVAGLDAGFIYNTFPLMDGRLVPADYAALQPFVANWFENVAAVQFNHRLLAVTTVTTALALWLWARRLELPPRARSALHHVAAMALIQFALGIATLLWVVPVWLGALHQAGALILFSFTLWTLHRLRPAPDLTSAAAGIEP
ncbi:MAG: heme A synthase [Alphaproteobacteria bacterium]|nr:MAG: heme A synthase [Alphaproteobacteria bacterium]